MNNPATILARIGEPPIDECWPWHGHVGPTGYGRVGRHGYAHRATYELMLGPIPDGLELDHLCRNRCCVNPQHLEPVTHAENCRRGAAARRGQASR